MEMHRACEPVVEARHVSKSFGNVRVLDDVSFEIGRGEYGRADRRVGIGKSTLIRAIAGLTPIDRARRDGPAGGERSCMLARPIQQRRPRRALGRRAAGARRRRLPAVQPGAAPAGADQRAAPACSAGSPPLARHARPLHARTRSGAAMRALARVGIAEHAPAARLARCRAASSSARRSPAPWCRAPSSSSPTSRSPRSIPSSRAA